MTKPKSGSKNTMNINKIKITNTTNKYTYNNPKIATTTHNTPTKLKIMLRPNKYASNNSNINISYPVHSSWDIENHLIVI